MKRYRVLAYDFDTRAVMLNTEIKDDWEENNRQLWLQNKKSIRDGLVFEFGAKDHERKIDDFSALGANPMSLISFHNVFMRQCRNAFVHGNYYPALVSACTLGERMLNRLILHLRSYYKSTPEYKKVYRKESFDNWDVAIETLVSWSVLLPEAADLFKKLAGIRNQSIHFNPETDDLAKETALEAIQTLQQIIEKQFSSFGVQPWYIPGTKGAMYVAKEHEETPFVKEVVLPNCAFVGPQHTLEHGHRGWVVHDDHPYPEKEITDEEFVALLPG